MRKSQILRKIRIYCESVRHLAVKTILEFTLWLTKSSFLRFETLISARWIHCLTHSANISFKSAECQYRATSIRQQKYRIGKCDVYNNSVSVENADATAIAITKLKLQYYIGTVASWCECMIEHKFIWRNSMRETSEPWNIIDECRQFAVDSAILGNNNSNKFKD